MSPRGFEGLEAWQKARQLVTVIHKHVVPLLPPEEKWDLSKQIRTSSKSVTANIAEGYGRYYYQDSVRFCYIARGSLDEWRICHPDVANLINSLPYRPIDPLTHQPIDPSPCDSSPLI